MLHTKLTSDFEEYLVSVPLRNVSMCLLEPARDFNIVSLKFASYISLLIFSISSYDNSILFNAFTDTLCT